MSLLLGHTVPHEFIWRPFLNTYDSLPYPHSSIWLATQAECHWDINFFYSDSKTDLKLLCTYCIKLQLFECAQDICIRLTSVCCMLLPHNHYRVHQHFKRHVCELSCSSKHRFLSISLFETNGYSMPLKTHWAKLVFSFISQCCYFNSQWTPMPAINKAPYVWKEIRQLGQLSSCSLLTCINQGCGGI